MAEMFGKTNAMTTTYSLENLPDGSGNIDGDGKLMSTHQNLMTTECFVLRISEISNAPPMLLQVYLFYYNIEYYLG